MDKVPVFGTGYGGSIPSAPTIETLAEEASVFVFHRWYLSLWYQVPLQVLLVTVIRRTDACPPRLQVAVVKKCRFYSFINATSIS